jgi:hypothetical protein
VEFWLRLNVDAYGVDLRQRIERESLSWPKESLSRRADW